MTCGRISELGDRGGKRVLPVKEGAGYYSGPAEPSAFLLLQILDHFILVR